MSRYKKLIITSIALFFVFICTFSVSIAIYFYTKRFEPTLYRFKSNSDSFYTEQFIQNPFRDKTKERIADSFLSSIKDKTISESFVDRKHMLNSYQDCGNGKLAEWELWDRIDNENETKFYYAVTRELSAGLYHLSFVILQLNREGSEWKVRGYICQGTSIKTWRTWNL